MTNKITEKESLTLFNWMKEHNLKNINEFKTQELPSALFVAVNDDNFEIANIILKIDKLTTNKLNAYKQNPLEYAIMRRSFEIANLLFDTNPESCKNEDMFNRIALHYAAVMGNYELSKKISDYSPIDIYAQDKNRKTPLHYAVDKQFFDITKMFLENNRKLGLSTITIVENEKTKN